jgi:hypothetical protein
VLGFCILSRGNPKHLCAQIDRTLSRSALYDAAWSYLSIANDDTTLSVGYVVTSV